MFTEERQNEIEKGLVNNLLNQVEDIIAECNERDEVLKYWQALFPDAKITIRKKENGV